MKIKGFKGDQQTPSPEHDLSICKKDDIYEQGSQEILASAYGQHCYVCGCQNHTPMTVVNGENGKYFLRKMKGHDHSSSCPLLMTYVDEDVPLRPVSLSSLMNVKKNDGDKKKHTRTRCSNVQTRSGKRQTFEGLVLDGIDKACVVVNSMGLKNEQEATAAVVPETILNMRYMKVDGYESFEEAQNAFLSKGEGLFLNVYCSESLSIEHGSRSAVSEELSYEMSLFEDEHGDRYANIFKDNPGIDTTGWLPRNTKKLCMSTGQSIIASEAVLKEAISNLFLFKNVIPGPYLIIEIVHTTKKKVVRDPRYKFDKKTKRLFICPVAVVKGMVLPVESDLERRSFTALLNATDCKVYKPRSLVTKTYGEGLRKFFGDDKALLKKPLNYFAEHYPGKKPIRPDLYIKVDKQYYVVEIAGLMKGSEDESNEEYVEHLEFKEEAFYQHMPEGINYIRAYDENDLIKKMGIDSPY